MVHCSRYGLRRVVQVASNFSCLTTRCSHLNDHSPLTTNIYFPAIPTIAAAFNKSVELINLTVTVYMVLQGICESVGIATIEMLG